MDAELTETKVSAQFPSIEAAAENVRRLKARKAPQAEVKAAVDAYLGLEAAVENVRRLKAAKASPAEVKAAVDAYVALTDVRGSASTASPAASSALEEAKEHIRVLKARMASQAEVRAAVEQYVSLKYGTPLPEPEPERKWEERPATREVEPEPEAVVTESAERVEEPVSQLSLPPTVALAAELVRTLKANLAAQSDVRTAVAHYLRLTREAAIASAAETVRIAKESGASQAEIAAAEAAYVALTQPQVSAPAPSSAPSRISPLEQKVPTLEEAAERVRALKASKATQEEVRAAVDDYVALKEPSSQDPIEAAAAHVRDLKARHASEDEVKAAVSAYVSAKGLPAPTKAVEVAVKSPEVDAAEKVVQSLKANMASQEEVRAAVEAYLALKYPSRVTETKVAETEVNTQRTPLSESASAPQTPLDAAMAKVRALKAAKASQEEVTAAVNEYKSLKEASETPVPSSPLEAAIAKVRAVKEARASQAEVSAAVAEYKALLAAGSEGPTKATEAAETKEKPASDEEPVVHVHMPSE